MRVAVWGMRAHHCGEVDDSEHCVVVYLDVARDDAQGRGVARASTPGALDGKVVHPFEAAQDGLDVTPGGVGHCHLLVDGRELQGLLVVRTRREEGGRGGMQMQGGMSTLALNQPNHGHSKT